MPRELIHQSSEGSTKVGWAKDGGNNVQVGLGVPGITVDGIPYDEVWVHLDRQEVNRFIRALRKARDDTFGPDV